MKKLLFGVIAFLVLSVLVQAAESADELAKKTAGDFLEAFKSNKIEAAMKIASTPFYIKNRDLIKDKAELEKHFDEEFKKNAKAIFEAAVAVRVEEEVKTLEEQFVQKLEEAQSEFTAGLVDKVDEYLDYVVSEWQKENEVAIVRITLDSKETLYRFIMGSKGEKYYEMYIVNLYQK